MDELSFRKQLFDWNMNVRDTIIPTSGGFVLYGNVIKTKIVSKDQEYLIYACIKHLKISDDLYNKLSNQMKMDDIAILKFVQDEYDQYLKDIRRQIIMCQRRWSRSFAQARAYKIMEILDYENIYHICDLVYNRIIPIELILKSVFNVSSNYGDHRRTKEKSEIQIDSRVLKAYNEKMKLKASTIVHPRKD